MSFSMRLNPRIQQRLSAREKSVETAVTRSFTHLNSENAQKYSPTTPITLNGYSSRAVVIDFYIPKVFATSQTILNATGGNYIGINANGLFCRSNYESIYVPLSDFNLYYLNRIVYQWDIINLVFSVTVNEGAIYSIPVTNKLNMQNIEFGLALSGLFANISLWSGTTDVSTPPTYKWALDSDGTGATEPATTGGIDLTRVNLTSANNSLYQLNESTTPDQWEQQPSGLVIPVGYAS
jgi:hypothetical protein